MAVIVLAAFLASGGLKAGTPLAMASTPVSATEPPAKALSRSRMPIGSSGSARERARRRAGGALARRVPADDVDERR